MLAGCDKCEKREAEYDDESRWATVSASVDEQRQELLEQRVALVQKRTFSFAASCTQIRSRRNSQKFYAPILLYLTNICSTAAGRSRSIPAPVQLPRISRDRSEQISEQPSTRDFHRDYTRSLPTHHTLISPPQEYVQKCVFKLNDFKKLIFDSDTVCLH